MAGIQEWRFGSNHFPFQVFTEKSHVPAVHFPGCLTKLRFFFQNIRLQQVVSIVIISPPSKIWKKCGQKSIQPPIPPIPPPRSQQRSQVTCQGQVRWKFLARHFQQVHQLPRRFRLWRTGFENEAVGNTKHQPRVWRYLNPEIYPKDLT